MKNLLNDYLKTQQQHLDVLIKALPNSLLALSDISVSSKEIVAKTNEFLNNINVLSSNYEQSTLNLIKDKHLNISAENKAFNKIIEKLNKELNLHVAELKLVLKTKLQLSKEKIANLQHEKRNSSKNIQAGFSKWRETYLNENNLLENKLINYKNIYLIRINAIYDQKNTDIYQINTHYNNLLADYHRVNKKRLRQQADRVNLQQEKKDKYLDFHKNDLIDARQNYYHSLNNLNEKINSVQAIYKELQDDNTSFFTNKREKTNEQLNNFTDFINDENQKILDDFEIHLKQIDSDVDILKTNYNNKTEELKTKYNRAITSLNVYLYQEKNNFNNIIETIDPSNKKDLKSVQKAFLKFEKEIKQKHKKLTKQYNLDLVSLTKSYTNDFQKQRHLRNLKDSEKNLAIKQNKKLLKEHEAFSLRQNKLYNSQKKLFENIVLNGLALEIAPLNVLTSLANYIYTTESQYYYQDHSDVEENFTLQINIIEKRSFSREIILNRSKDRIEINNQAEIKQNEFNHYFNMETEKNKRDYEIKTLNHKKEINKAFYNIQAQKGKHQQEIFMEKLFHQTDKINTLNNIEKEKNNLEITLLKEQNQAHVLQQKYELQNKNSSTEVKYNINQHNLSYKYIIKVINEYNRLLNLIYLQLKKILLTVNNKNNTNSSIIEHQFQLFNNTVNLFNTTIDLTAKKTINHFQKQLNDLIEQKHKQSYESLLNQHNQALLKINNNIASITEQLNTYMISQANISNKIQSLNIDNLNINKEITHFSNKQQILKKNNPNSHLIKLAQQNILSKRKTLVKNKENIKLYSLQNKQIYKRIVIFENQLDLLNKAKEKEKNNKEIKEKRLNSRLHKEGKTYYKSIQSINNSHNNLLLFVKELKVNFNNLLNSQLKDSSVFKNQTTKFNNYFNNLQLKLKSFHNNLFELVNTNNNFILNKEKEQLNNLNKTFNKNVIKHKKEHKNDVKKINLNLNSLYKYLDNTIKLSSIRLNKSLLALKEKQRLEILKLQRHHNLLLLNLKQLETDYNNLAKAFNLNKQQALTNESEYLKQRLKQAEQQNNILYRKTQNEIAEITDQIHAFEKRRQMQLDYIHNNDKENRRALFKKQSLIIKDNQKEFKILVKQKPVISSKIKLNRLKVHNKKIKIKKTFSFKKKFQQIFKKITLPLTIKKHQYKAIREIKKA